MDRHLFGLFVDVDKLPCLVVGGGAVATRKVKSLLKAGAQVRIVSPSLAAELADLATAKRIEWLPRDYEASDMPGWKLVFAATSDPAVNRQVAQDAKRHGALVNVCDDPILSSVHVPAVIEKGMFQVAISTGGASPRLAQTMKRLIQASLPPGLAELTRWLQKARSIVHKSVPDAELREVILHRLTDSTLMEKWLLGETNWYLEEVANIESLFHITLGKPERGNQ